VPRGARTGRRWATAALLALLALGASPARAAGPPQIGALWTSNVVGGAATLNGEVARNGLATTYRFEYVTAAEFKASGFTGAKRIPVGEDAPVPSGAATFSKVSQHPSGLSAGTRYRYRLVAQNSAGPAVSEPFSFITQGVGGPEALPDGRGWEMVSPADKNGGQVQGFGENFGGDVLQAAAEEPALTYSSLSSFGEGAQGAPYASQYISRRGAGGWSTENISGPTSSGAYGEEPDGVPYQLFSADLSLGVLFDGSAYELFDTLGGALTPLPLAGADVSFAGASPDLHHLVFSREGGLDEYSEGQLELELPNAALAAGAAAVSTDGSRIYFTQEGNLYLREGALTKQLDGGLGGGGTFQAATPDGALAFYTKGGHLYRYDALAATTSEIDPGGAVEGPLQVSADGERFAFLSKASLSGYDNTDLNSGEADAEVYLYDSEAAPAEALRCLSCNPTEERPLGPSTIPGVTPNGTGPNATRSYEPRALVAGGRRVFFDSADALVLSDTDNAPDVYEWEAQGTGGCAAAPGCLALLSKGREGGASFIDASESGADAYLLTGVSLVPWADPGSVDVYDAREGGGFPEPPPPSICKEDSCQPLPSPPEEQALSTLASGPGNPPVRYTRQGHRKRHRHRHRHRHHRGHRHRGGL
jgi:hypothetical protein